jgi:hypothetical protein
MVRTILRKIAIALKKTYYAWLTALQHVQSGKLEEGWENGIALGRFRETIYARTKIGGG